MVVATEYIRWLRRQDQRLIIQQTALATLHLRQNRGLPATIRRAGGQNLPEKLPAWRYAMSSTSTGRWVHQRSL